MEKQRKIGRLDLAIWLGFMVFAVSAIIVAVTLPEISNTFSTDLSEGGGLETARNLVLLMVLLAAGMLAKRWGKKRFLTLGQYVMAIGLLLASFSQNYATLVAALFVIGLGGGFSEALLNPLITDLHKDEAGRYMNLSHAFYPGGIVVSALLFGELLTAGYSWRLMFQLSAGLTLILAVIFSVLPFPPQEQDESSYLETFGEILRIKGFWLFAAAIFLGGSIESALMFWSRTYVESYLSDIPRSGAVAVVIFAGAMATGRFITSYLANKTQPYALSGYSIFVAEIASTFNEALLLQHMLKTETRKDVRLALLCNHLDNARATVFPIRGAHRIRYFNHFNVEE